MTDPNQPRNPPAPESGSPPQYPPSDPYATSPAYGQQPPPFGQPDAYGQQPAHGQLQPYGQPPTYGQPPANWQPPGYPQPFGQLGNVRSTGICILLAIVTLGIYTFVWWFQTHEEMKRHTGNGLGGGVALALLLVGFFIPVSLALPFLTSSEVGQLYQRRGMPPPVSGLTGLWYFPGFLILVGPIVWFVLTNQALNEYWERAQGQPA